MNNKYKKVMPHEYRSLFGPLRSCIECSHG